MKTGWPRRGPLAKSAWLRGLELTTSAVLGLLGLKLGYDFGVRLAGVWLGVIMGVNAALFCALAASMATDRLLRLLRLLRLWRAGGNAALPDKATAAPAAPATSGAPGAPQGPTPADRP